MSKAAIALLGTGLTFWSMRDSESPVFALAMPLMRNLINDPELAHRLSINFLKCGLLPQFKLRPNDIDRLKVKFLGLEIASPIGLAAGMDKNGEAIDAFFAQGFSYVEVGTITPLPQPGNPKPRYFRLPLDNAAINRYGFNSNGMIDVAQRLQKRPFKNTFGGIDIISGSNQLLALNIGKNKNGNELEDYPNLIKTLGPLSDLIVVNISSPNTPGLRNLQGEKYLEPLLTKICDTRLNVRKDLPILVKVAPDLGEDEIESFAKVLGKFPIQGVIIANTSVQRPDTLTKDPNIDEIGGLSGPPLIEITLPVVRKFYKLLPRSTIIVGCGGISSGADAIKYAKAGATLVQAHTALGYQGPSFAAKIQREILEEMNKMNVKTWSELIGNDNLQIT